MLSVTTARKAPSPLDTSPTHVAAAALGPVCSQAPCAELLKMTGAPPVAGETGLPEKMTEPSAMTVSRLCDAPSGVSKVRRQEPTKSWPVAAGSPDWAPERSEAEPNKRPAPAATIAA